jgi:hypothetical protein
MEVGCERKELGDGEGSCAGCRKNIHGKQVVITFEHVELGRSSFIPGIMP